MTTGQGRGGPGPPLQAARGTIRACSLSRVHWSSWSQTPNARFPPFERQGRVAEWPCWTGVSSVDPQSVSRNVASLGLSGLSASLCKV